MSTAGPSQLGTILIQRLHSLLGVTQSQQANLMSGAKANTITPAEKSQSERPLKHPDSRPTTPLEQKNHPTRIASQHTDKGSSNAPMSGSSPQNSLQTHLGRTAQLILQLLNQQPKANALLGRQPLMQPPQIPAQGQTQPPTSQALLIQQKLRNEMTHSGLFYESLLHESMHKRIGSGSHLRQQPQNVFAMATASAIAADEHSTELPLELRTIVRQQLELLATQQWEWRGELWPGVQMLWRNQALPDTEEHPHPNPQPNHSAPWTSQIELLFSVDDTLNFNIQWTTQELVIHISATPTRAKQLKPFRDLLEKRLSDIHPNSHIYWKEQPRKSPENQTNPPIDTSL
ncbi:MAG TPA: hypothetical protein VK051_05945 [Paenalcaligenes sp.]|nr:hypothetical protein [Paenalcaligenes sp.]